MTTDLVIPYSGTGGMYRDWFINQFLDKAEIGEDRECWSWKWRKAHGYGYLIKQRRPRASVVVRVHRLVYELAYGVPLSREQHVHHKCRNRACYNPTHLSLTDQHNHMSDHHRPTNCKHGHAFTPENSYVYSNGRRACRECMRARDRRLYHDDQEFRERKKTRQRQRYRAQEKHG